MPRPWSRSSRCDTLNDDSGVKTKERIGSLSAQITNTTTLVGDTRAVPVLDDHDQFYYDPEATWTIQEEKRVTRKTDIRLLGWFCVMFFGLQLDRGNLSSALTDNFLGDLGFTTTDFNNGVMLQRACFLIAEFPGQILIMRYGYKNMFPTLITAWGTVAWAQAWMHNRAGFYTARALIGLLEGAFVPATFLSLSRFYKNTELGLRVALLASSISISKGLSSLLAAAIFQMRGIAGKPGWFWLFLISGLVTCLIGILTFFFLPASPTNTKTLLWRRGWFTEREQIVALNRLLRDDPSKAQPSKGTKTSLKDIYHALKDPSMTLLFLFGLVGFIPVSPILQYLPLLLRRLSFSVFLSNVLCIPSEILHCIMMLLITWSSEHFNERTWHCVMATFWYLPLLVALLCLPAEGYQWGRFTIATLVAGSPSCYPILVSWISRNCFGVKRRGLALVIFSAIDQVGSVGAAQIYRKDDAPYYYTGNKILVAICGFSILILVGQREVLRYLNRKKERVWEQMGENEKSEYRDGGGNENLTCRFSI